MTIEGGSLGVEVLREPADTATVPRISAGYGGQQSYLAHEALLRLAASLDALGNGDLAFAREQPKTLPAPFSALPETGMRGRRTGNVPG